MLEIFLSAYSIILYAIPTIIIVLFGICLYRYISAKRSNEKVPGTFPPEEIMGRKCFLIITSVLLVILVAIVLGITVLISIAIANM